MANSAPASEDFDFQEDCDRHPFLTPQPRIITLANNSVLGCLRNCHHLQPEDPEPKPDGKQHYAQWQDPFRMSVLDFQHRALDKLAEILTIYLEMKGVRMKPEKYEDVHALLLDLKGKANKLSVELGYPDEKALLNVCNTLSKARNAFAHQKYNKVPKSEEDKLPENLPEGYTTTRTFEHTKMVIEKCIELTERVKCVQGLPDDKKREVQIRCSDLESLLKNFEEFSIYRVREKHNIEIFSKTFIDEEEMKKVAKEVLDKLNSRIKEDKDLCKLLVCVVAPRCNLEIKRDMTKGEELAKTCNGT